MKTNSTFNFSILLLVFLSFQSLSFAQKYKELMKDNTVNFYDVIAAGEDYFKTIDKNAKGSGYKNFMRWVVNNEYKYYPSGNRMIIDPAFPTKAFDKFLKSNNVTANKNNMAGGWREIGPFLVENITGHYAAGMGRVEDFYVDPGNPQKIFIGSRSGGFWSTLNEGNTWSKSDTENLPASGVNTIAVDPSNTDHVYINVRNSDNGYSYGIYESNNAGTTFTETNFNPATLGLGGLGSNFEINNIVHHPTVSGLLLVATSQGIFKTTDNFATISTVVNTGYFFQIRFHPTNSNIVYAVNHSSGNRDLVYVSNNAGNSFSTTAISGNNNASGRIDVTPNAANTIYFASSSGFWRSNNSGVSFTFVSNSISGNNQLGTNGFAVSDTNVQNLVLGGVDAGNSTDGGLNFTQRTDWSLFQPSNGTGTLEQNYFNSNSYVHADIRVAKAVNGVFYVGTDGFLAKSTNGGVNWTNLMQAGSPAIRENYKLGVSQSDNRVAICGSQDNGTTIKRANEWVEAYGADGMEGIILPLNPDYMIGSFQFGGRIRTLNAGESNSIVTSNATDGWWEAPLAYDPNDHFKIYDFRNGVYVSDDFGLNYTYVGAPSFLTASYWDQIRNAEIAQNDSNIIVVNKGSDIEKSTDGGVTWTSIKSNLPAIGHQIQDIAFNPNDDNDITVVHSWYNAGNEMVFRTTDGGASWSNITFNITDIPVHSVVIDHTSNPNIYIGTEVGVYYKPLNGNTWTLYNTDLPKVTIEELEINYGANTIKAATWGRGLWEYDLVGRADFPSIETTEITDTPTLNNPKVGVSQFVTSTIDYAGTLSTVEVKYSVNNQLFNNTIAMSNSSGNTWVSNQALPDGAIGDKVYFKVVATGSSSDTSETYKFMYQLRDFAYCDSQGQAGTGADYINRVTLGSFVNNSGQALYTYYDTLAPIELNLGDTYTLGSRLNATFTPDVAAAWIDFNNNAEFEESEAITMSPYSANESTGSFTVPIDAVLNQEIRLRVSNIYNNTTDPCGTFFGEVEDYRVTITDNSLSVDEFNTLDATLSIYPNPSNGDVFVKAENNITKVELFDIRGRKVIQQNNLQSSETKFNIEHLQESMYILKVYTAERTITKKILKIK